MLPHWMSVMFSWASHICGSTMLFTSLDPVVSLLLWGVISIGYQSQFQLLSHLNSVSRQYLILKNSTSSQSFQKVNKRTPLQPQSKHLLSNKSRSTILQKSVKIPSAHNNIMYPDWLKRSNPSNHRFVTTFNKLSNTTSPIRQAAHQDAYSTNTFPSPWSTQQNGYH